MNTVLLVIGILTILLVLTGILDQGILMVMKNSKNY